MTARPRLSADGRSALSGAVVVDADEDARSDWQRGLLMVLAAVLALGWIDANDRRVEERAAREASEAELRSIRGAAGLPPVTFVIEARTPAEAEAKLAGVADAADGLRAQIRAVK